MFTAISAAFGQLRWSPCKGRLAITVHPMGIFDGCSILSSMLVSGRSSVCIDYGGDGTISEKDLKHIYIVVHILYAPEGADNESIRRHLYQ